MQKKIIIIGGGPAGIEAAKAAATSGAQATLVSNSPIGGRAGWHSLLPSKVWLTAADTLGLIEEAATLGIVTEQPTPAVDQVLDRIHKLAENWNHGQAEQLRQLGVKIVTGTASFTNENSVAVQDKDEQTQTLTADAIIIAAGSVPIFPPNMKPDGQRIIAPRFAKALKQLPKSMVVVGGGVTGSEFAYLFNRVGVQVTWIIDEYGVLPTFHPEAAQALAATLAENGVRIAFGQPAARIEVQDEGIRVVLDDGATFEAEMAFLAIGRKGDLAGLNLAAAGVGEDWMLDDYGRILNKSIYMVGDVTGAPMVANRAMAQARIAGLHAAGAADVRPFRPETVITATYTEPQVAQVGDVSDGLEVVQVDYTAVLKTHLLPKKQGFLRLTYSKDTRIVKGAVACGDHAADLLAPIAVAIQQEAALDDLAAIYPGHPTLSELAFSAARNVS